jgi:hypothetical protein
MWVDDTIPAMRVSRCIFGLTAVPALACSCGSYEPVKACEMIDRAPVIFRGRAIDTNHDPTAGFDQATLYRFSVVESFKGLPANVKEVFIDPASFTSCYRDFAFDRDYLVYTGRALSNFAGMSIVGRHPPNSPGKQNPAAWRGLEDLRVYVVDGCNPTRAVDRDDPNLAYLRSRVPGAEAWIEGRAVQNFSRTSRYAAHVAAADAVITASPRAGEPRKTRVQPDGAYRLTSVAPGKYTMSAESLRLGVGKIVMADMDVPAGGCAVANFSFETRATISGKVMDSAGRAAAAVRLEVGDMQIGGKVRTVPGTWSSTDKDGYFRISNVPVGRVVVAANLNGAPTSDMPFDTVYAPGTQEVTRARVFEIRPGQELTGVALQLPPPLLFGDLYVDVQWPDGSPASGGARANASWNGANADFQDAPSDGNRVKLRLAVGRTYEVGGDWLYWRLGQRFLYVKGAHRRTLDFKRDGQVIKVRLEASRPN